MVGARGACRCRLGGDARGWEIAQHNGWFYFHGGDATWYYTSAWVLGHGHIPQGSIGYGYSLLLAPIAQLAGPNILVGMPWIVVFNVVVLAPIALISVYGITCMIGGRSFGYLASLLWVVFPLAVIPYFSAGYHARYVDITLPPALGLTARGDFPSLVFLLVATYFGLRFLASRNDLDAIASGLAVGLAIAIKPSNALFLPAPVLALVVARRPRGLALLAVGMIPSLLGLAVWKYRGLGYLPVFSNGPGATLVGAVTISSSVHLHLDQYLPFNWTQLSQNLDGFRRWTWSRFLIELVAVAGLVGLARRSLPAAALVGAWLASYLLIKGSSPVVNFADGTFLTHLIPAFPAYFLLAVSCSAPDPERRSATGPAGRKPRRRSDMAATDPRPRARPRSDCRRPRDRGPAAPATTRRSRDHERHPLHPDRRLRPRGEGRRAHGQIELAGPANVGQPRLVRDLSRPPKPARPALPSRTRRQPATTRPQTSSAPFRGHAPPGSTIHRPAPGSTGSR